MAQAIRGWPGSAYGPEQIPLLMAAGGEGPQPLLDNIIGLLSLAIRLRGKGRAHAELNFPLFVKATPKDAGEASVPVRYDRVW